MAGSDEEDGYSDDDLDALPPNDFLELQQLAIQSTQKQRANGKLELPNQHGRSAHVPISARDSVNPQKTFPQEPSSDYGNIDDEILDGDILEVNNERRPQPFSDGQTTSAFREATQRESWRQQRYGAPNRLQQPYQPSDGLQKQAANTLQQRLDLEDSGYTENQNDELMLDAPYERNQLQDTSQVEDIDTLQTKVAEVSISFPTIGIGIR